MKKISLYLLALATTMVACTNEDFTDWETPQQTTPEEAGEAVSVSLSATPAAVINIETVAEDSVVLFTPALTMSEGCTLTAYELTVGGEPLACSTEGKVATKELNKVILTTCGHENEQNAEANLKAYIDANGTSVIANATFNVAVIPYVPPVYYVVGGISGWSDSDMRYALYPQSKTVHSYTALWSGAWDLKVWYSADFGIWDNAYGCAVDGDNAASGALINVGAEAISAPTAEYYTFTFDVENMTYTWTRLDNQTPTEYATIGIIGDFNGWGDDVDMTQTTAHNWYLQTTIEGTGGLKFRANDDWSANWGADIDIAAQNYGPCYQDGANINVPAGTYSIYFNDITGECLFVAE